MSVRNHRPPFGLAPTALFRITAIVLLVVSALGASAAAQDPTPASPDDPDRFRGVIAEIDGSSMVVHTSDGDSRRLKLSDDVTVFSLSSASFTDVDFGTYVGAVSVRLNEYSPIVRDSLSWLHMGFELRIIDEQLRGIALGHTVWDLTSETVMSHGWVDDLEVRILSIKYGPTEEEETDVEIPRDVPILKMALADTDLVVPGAHIFAGARQNSDGNYETEFVFVGENGVVPGM